MERIRFLSMEWKKKFAGHLQHQLLNQVSEETLQFSNKHVSVPLRSIPIGTKFINERLNHQKYATCTILYKTIIYIIQRLRFRVSTVLSSFVFVSFNICSFRLGSPPVGRGWCSRLIISLRSSIHGNLHSHGSFCNGKVGVGPFKRTSSIFVWSLGRLTGCGSNLSTTRIGWFPTKQ